MATESFSKTIIIQKESANLLAATMRKPAARIASYTDTKQKLERGQQLLKRLYGQV